MSRTSRIAGSFAIVMIAYWAYALLAVPWIEPTVDQRRQGKISQEERDRASQIADEQLDRIRDMFSPGGMEALGLKKPVIIESNRAKLLFQTYEHQSDGSVVLRPCVIVFAYEGPAEDEAQRHRQSVIIEAPGGARLQFDPPLDINRVRIGRLVRGQFDGQVTIRSDWKQPGPEDDLLIVTRDIQLTEQTISTPHPVEFRWGPHFGRGREMVMELLAGEPRPGMEAAGTNIVGIESFELRRIERLHLDLGQPEKGTGPICAKHPPGRSGKLDLSPFPAADGQTNDMPVEIQCRGPFRFDVLRRVATFSERVDVLKLNPGGPADQIACDLLSLYFAERKPQGAGKGVRNLLPERPEGCFAQKVPDTFSGSEPGSLDLVAERLECRGNPVVVTAPSRKLNARAPRIEYNLLTEAIVLDGNREVFLQQGPNEIHAQSLYYQAAKQGGLGQVVAQGPGWLRGRLDEADDRQLEAVWKKRLQVYPHRQKQVISLDGGAELKYQGVGQLQAREIFFWLAESPPIAGDKRARLRPDRMLARDDVRLNSPRLSGKVNQLEVWFKEGGQGLGFGVRGSEVGKRPATAVAGGNAAGVAVQPGAGVAVQLPPQQIQLPPQHTLPQNSQRRYEVVGRLLQANVLLGGPQPVMSHLLVEDGVCFRETQPSSPNEKPLLVRGDRLVVENATERRTGCQPVPLAVVTVTGRPARFEGQGLGMTGSNINLDRGANRLWIDGAGRMDMPLPDKLPNQAPVGGGVLTIDWRGGMDFDGDTARFEESVVASGPSQQLRTDKMEVQLRRPISFSEPNPPEQPQVEEIRCYGGVAMENRTFDRQQQLNSFDRMQVTDLAVNVQSGALTAGGPGWFNSVSRGTLVQNPNLGSSTDNPSSKNQLHCLTVRFQGSISGNLLRRRLTFHNQVRTARAPVADWNAMLTADNPDALGPDGVTLRCDRLSVVEIPAPSGNRRSVELEAFGNTVVEGTTFTARGHRITYGEAKDLLVLEGDGRNDAELFRQLKLGTPPSRVAARKILYWPKTKRLKLIDARSLEIGRFPKGNGAMQ
ncbi:MAG: hypothetical protein KKA28_16170 [Planctomycetes bacterium]|nr:hypothetical protein [Planctomycetota bacterium]MCG2682075.1 hypothetical protein [Planctomycetales bacterium]